MKTVGYILTAIILIVAAFFLGRVTKNCPTVYDTLRIDTVTLYDTIRDTVLVPKIKYIARIDTVLLRVPGDTVKVEVEIPIERKVYETSDYKAEIEGFRPSLVSMELYRQTQAITEIQTVSVPDRKCWGIGIQAGYGYAVGGKFYPYIGVGVSYNIITW
jgi:opacity protein-like surface antigen